MAESTLSISFIELQREVARHLGWGSDESRWTASQLARVKDIVHAGVRRALSPPPINGRHHRWSFLEPTRSLTVEAPYSTGTVTATDGSATITLAAGAWPVWATAGEVQIEGRRYDVLTRNSSSSLTMTGPYSGTTGSGKSYTLSHANVALPDDFAGFVGERLHYADSSITNQDVLLRSDAMLRQWRAAGLGVSRPTHAAVRPKAPAAAGQRWELMLWPSPSATAVMQYRSRILVGKMVSSTDYPPGGMQMGQVYAEWAMAVADEQDNDSRGLHYDLAMQLTSAAVADDIQQHSQKNLGKDGSGEGAWSSLHLVTVNG